MKTFERNLGLKKGFVPQSRPVWCRAVLWFLALLLGTFVGPLSAFAIQSDDFNQDNLNTDLWTIVDPLQDATVTMQGAGTGDAHVLLSVPAGPSHDAWTVNEAARLMQSANDTDFGVEVKFDSQVTEKYQDQGIIVEESSDNWLRFDVLSDSSRTRIFAASVVNGSASVKVDQTITPS